VLQRGAALQQTPWFAVRVPAAVAVAALLMKTAGVAVGQAPSLVVSAYGAFFPKFKGQTASSHFSSTNLRPFTNLRAFNNDRLAGASKASSPMAKATQDRPTILMVSRKMKIDLNQ
jgi:hypothetical protein